MNSLEWSFCNKIFQLKTTCNALAIGNTKVE